MIRHRDEYLYVMLSSREDQIWYGRKAQPLIRLKKSTRFVRAVWLLMWYLCLRRPQRILTPSSQERDQVPLACGVLWVSLFPVGLCRGLSGAASTLLCKDPTVRHGSSDYGLSACQVYMAFTLKSTLGVSLHHGWRESCGIWRQNKIVNACPLSGTMICGVTLRLLQIVLAKSLAPTYSAPMVNIDSTKLCCCDD